MGDLIDSYLRARLGVLRPSTQSDYRNIIKQLRAVFGAMDPKSLLPRDIYAYRSRFAGPRGNCHVAVLSSILNLGVETGLIDANPCHQIKRKMEHPRTRYVTDNL